MVEAATITRITDWLIDGARSAVAPDQVLAILCERLVAAGISLWRAAIFVRTLHPQVMGRRFVWRAGQGVEIAQEAYGVFKDSDFTGGILTRLFENGLAARRRLDDGADLSAAPLLSELRQQGATEFVALPLVFTDATIHTATWTTRQEGGFSAAELAAIETIRSPLARMAEI